MARLTLSAGISAILGLATPEILGQTPPSTQGNKAAESKTSGDESHRVQPIELTLGIAGLGAEGCLVEIKPATPACRFTPIKRKVGSSGRVDNIMIKDLQVRGVDRNCSLAITVTEPGRKPRTILRGFRLAAPPADPIAPVPVQSFSCWLSSPSRIAIIEESSARK